MGKHTYMLEMTISIGMENSKKTRFTLLRPDVSDGPDDRRTSDIGKQVRSSGYKHGDSRSQEAMYQLGAEMELERLTR